MKRLSGWGRCCCTVGIYCCHVSRCPPMRNLGAFVSGRGRAGQRSNSPSGSSALLASANGMPPGCAGSRCHWPDPGRPARPDRCPRCRNASVSTQTFDTVCRTRPAYGYSNQMPLNKESGTLIVALLLVGYLPSSSWSGGNIKQLNLLHVSCPRQTSPSLDECLCLCLGLVSTIPSTT